MANQTGKGLENIGRLRHKLRRLAPYVENGVRPEMDRFAGDVAIDMRTLTPIDTGNLVHLIDHKVSRDGLGAQVGIRTQHRAEKGFYFPFLDKGTRSYMPGDVRRRSDSKTTTKIKRRIPARPALHIRERAFDMNYDEGLRRIREAIDKQLGKVCASE